jgi:hypothetical protein
MSNSVCASSVSRRTLTGRVQTVGQVTLIDRRSSINLTGWANGGLPYEATFHVVRYSGQWCYMPFSRRAALIGG